MSPICQQQDPAAGLCLSRHTGRKWPNYCSKLTAMLACVHVIKIWQHQLLCKIWKGGGLLYFKCVDWNFWHCKFSSLAKQPAWLWDLLVPPRLLVGLHSPAQETAAVLGGTELHYSTAADPINTAACSDRAEPQPGDSSFLAMLLADAPTHTPTLQQATQPSAQLYFKAVYVRLQQEKQWQLGKDSARILLQDSTQLWHCAPALCSTHRTPGHTAPAQFSQVKFFSCFRKAHTFGFA